MNKLKEGFYLNKDLYFEYVEEFVDFILNELECNEDKFVTVIAKFDEAKEILSNAMLCEDVNFDFLHIESPEIDGYNDEFVLSFWMNDGILEIGCEKLKDEAGDYICPCGDIVFLFSNCSSRIIPLCEDSELYFVSLEDECDCDEEHCCDCCECADKDDDIYGFVANSENNGRHCELTYYSSNPVNTSKIINILKEFGF